MGAEVEKAGGGKREEISSLRPRKRQENYSFLPWLLDCRGRLVRGRKKKKKKKKKKGGKEGDHRSIRASQGGGQELVIVSPLLTKEAQEKREKKISLPSGGTPRKKKTP